MARTPVVLCLNAAGEPLAHRLAAFLNAPLHGRANRVKVADAFFPNALDHARDLFAAGIPIVGVCAAGILVRAVAPLLSDKSKEPPVLSVSDDGKVVVPLLGGHHGANRLATRIAAEIDATPAVTTAGDIALGVALDEPPSGYRLANPEHAKPVMTALLNGAGLSITGGNIFGLKPTGNDIDLTVTDAPVEGSDRRLVYHPQTHALGLDCVPGTDPQEIWDLIETTLTDKGIAPGAIAGSGIR